MDTFLDPLLAWYHEQSFLPEHSLYLEQYVGLAAGLALLIFGKRLYWLAIGGLGAMAAIWIAQQLGQTLEPEIRVGVTGIAGLAGAFFAIAAQKTALKVAGAILGGLVSGWASYLICVNVLFQDPAAWPILVAIIGAFFGLLFAQKLFNAALIVISSAAGALLLVQGMSSAWLWSQGQETLGVVILFGVGLIAQTGRRKAPRADE